ncbi:MAG: hypothetical protein LBS20_10960 [Prevotella sp.]|jgi:hypothetical protein|nr:hypothetical protein [Prevotella sp.]
MNAEEKKEQRKILIEARMNAKAQIEAYRYLEEATGDNYEKEINALLDRISLIDKMEEELKK